MFTDEDELNKLMITTRAGSEKVTARAMGNRCSTKSNVFFSNRTGHYPHRTESSYSMQDKIKEIIKYLEEYKYLRIVGTEEFMEIPIKIGAELERKGHHVTVQATTRSKIDVLESYFDGEDSGIKSRYEVASAYESDRKNYIYNMDESSDAVVIMTDSHSDCDINKLVSDIEKISYGKTESVILIYI
jgi:phosphoribosyl-AMP cyclohydrolase